LPRLAQARANDKATKLNPKRSLTQLMFSEYPELVTNTP